MSAAQSSSSKTVSNAARLAFEQDDRHCKCVGDVLQSRLGEMGSLDRTAEGNGRDSKDGNNDRGYNSDLPELFGEEARCRCSLVLNLLLGPASSCGSIGSTGDGGGSRSSRHCSRRSGLPILIQIRLRNLRAHLELLR